MKVGVQNATGIGEVDAQKEKVLKIESKGFWERQRVVINGICGGGGHHEAFDGCKCEMWKKKTEMVKIWISIIIEHATDVQNYGTNNGKGNLQRLKPFRNRITLSVLLYTTAFNPF